jgi:transcriptional regulator with XRE-family HTH domain
MDDFSARLKQERQRLDLNQAEFSALGGVQKQAQFHYERGTRRPNSDYLAKIASAGVDVHYLLTGRTATLALDGDEQAVLTGYRALDARKRTAIRALIEAMDTLPGSTQQNDESSQSPPSGRSRSTGTRNDDRG